MRRGRGQITHRSVCREATKLRWRDTIKCEPCPEAKKTVGDERKKTHIRKILVIPEKMFQGKI